MLSWYETREGCNLQHNNQTIPAKKKILLSIEQAQLHNTYQEQVFKCDEPKNQEEVGTVAEYQEWVKSVGATKLVKEENKVTSKK
jgi:hypothetical protein